MILSSDLDWQPVAASQTLQAQGLVSASRSLSAMDGAEAAYTDVLAAVLEAETSPCAKLQT